MNTRRLFMAQSLAAGVAAPMLGQFAQDLDEQGVRVLPDDLVLDFVRTAHTNLERTRTLLDREPRLLRAAWEWAPGDFESAIDAAAHTGSIEIVLFLLSRQAPYTIFVAATLGHVGTVRSVLDANPDIIRAEGPHGLSLLDHAIAGGENAQPVAKLLEERGAIGKPQTLDLPTPPRLIKRLLGRYKLEADGRTMEFDIVAVGDGVHVRAPGRPQIRLLHQGQARFALEGTPAELIFEVTHEPCRRVMLREGFPIGVAHRIPSTTP